MYCDSATLPLRTGSGNIPSYLRIQLETQPRSVIAGKTAFAAGTRNKPSAKITGTAGIAYQSACADASSAAAELAVFDVSGLRSL